MTVWRVISANSLDVFIYVNTHNVLQSQCVVPWCNRSTLDFESRDPSSNLGGTFLFSFSFFLLSFPMSYV